MAYTYHISFDNAIWDEFYPMSNNKITMTQDSGEIFMRPKIDEIKIDERRNSAIYTTLETNFYETAEFGKEVFFKIKRGTTDVFYFLCSINDAKIDDQNNIFYVTPRPNDSYEKVLKYYDRKFTWEGFSTITAPFLNGNNFIPEVDLSWAGAVGTASWLNNTADPKKAWAAVSTDADSDSWIVIIINNLSTTGEDFYLSITNSDGSVVYAAAQEITANGKYDFDCTNPALNDMYVQFSHTPLVGGELGTFDYKIYYPVLYAVANSLKSRISTLFGATYMNTGLTSKSTILWNDALPTVKPPNIDAYIANPLTAGNDYVIEGPEIWNDLVIGRTAGLIPEIDVITVSFKDVMDILKTKLRMFWYIDSDGFFRIEHEKFFADFTAQIDLTSSAYDAYRPEVDRRVYNYEKSNIYSQITYLESNEVTAEWLDKVTNFDIIKTTPNTIDITPPHLSTDVASIIGNTDAVGSGLFLAHCLPDVNSPFIDFAESQLTADLYIMNGNLSWAWLRNNYYGYFAEADKDEDTFAYDGVKRFKKQVGVKFYYNGDITWLRPVTLLGGTGWIEKMELDLASGWYTIDVGFDPY